MAQDLVLGRTAKNVTADLSLGPGVYRIQNLDSSDLVYWLKQAAAPAAGARAFVLRPYGFLNYWAESEPSDSGNIVAAASRLWMWTNGASAAILVAEASDQGGGVRIE